MFFKFFFDIKKEIQEYKIKKPRKSYKLNNCSAFLV
jgi:polyphosphate kinase 2 (PPK2 family)